jgi:hypothetical protein
MAKAGDSVRRAAKRLGAQAASVSKPRATKAVVAKTKTLARAVTNMVGGKATAEELSAVKAIHEAGLVALSSGVDEGDLLALRRQSIKDMGAFTRKVGEIILRTGETPLEFLVRNMRDTKVDVALRVRCAEAALPYVHQRLPALDTVDDVPSKDKAAVQAGSEALRDVTDEELAVLERMARRMAEREVIQHG